MNGIEPEGIIETVYHLQQSERISSYRIVKSSYLRQKQILFNQFSSTTSYSAIMVRPRNVLMAWDSSVSSCAASDALKRYNGDLEAAKRYLAAKNIKKPSTTVAVRPRNILMAWDSSVSSHAASDALKRANGDLEAAKRYLAAENIGKPSAKVVIPADDTTTVCELCDRDLGTNDQLKTLDCCHRQFCTDCYDNTNFTEDQCCGTEICDSCVDPDKICEGCDQLWCEMKTFDCCQEERCQNCYDNTNFTEDQCCGTEICDSCVDPDTICDGCNLMWCAGGQLTLDETSGTHLCQNCIDTKSSAKDNEGDEDNMTEGNPRKRKM